MLTKKETEFLAYWSRRRMRGKKDIKTYLKGLSVGLLIGIGVLVAVVAGWYKRANMEASTQLNPAVFLLAIFLTGIFMAFIYQHYQWEMKEQLYAELLEKKKKEETNSQMQQSLSKKGQ